MPVWAKSVPNLANSSVIASERGESLKQNSIDLRRKKSTHQAMHRDPMVVGNHIGFACKKHFLELLDVHPDAEKRFPIATDLLPAAGEPFPKIKGESIPAESA
jgi:hypothetical protein